MNALDPALLQFGALGVLLVVIYFAGKIAQTYVASAAANQTRLIDGTLDRIKELTTELGDNTKATVELAKATTTLTAAVNAHAKDQSDEHKAMVDGLKRLGGFRPSSDRDVRAQTGYRKGPDPDSR